MEVKFTQKKSIFSKQKAKNDAYYAKTTYGLPDWDDS